jgi:UDP-glucuronate 4-epimerase
MAIDNQDCILITGTAGFIGMHIALRASSMGLRVIGLDNLNDYYDVSLKRNRLKEQGIDVSKLESGETLWGSKGIGFLKGSLENKSTVDKVFQENNVVRVVHLAAQAGVRYSIDAPEVYIQSNIIGFFNILEACRTYQVKHLVYASSSSVYGLNKEVPFSEDNHTDHPISLYASTKKSNELMAHTYSHLFNIPTTGLRFFTVYGPWGRPDMALFKFTKAILNNEPIDVYNNGNMSRDFTYIDDIVSGVMSVLFKEPESQELKGNTNFSPSISSAPYRVLNIGRNEPVSLDTFIIAIEKATGRQALRNNLPIQPGDVERTYAEIDLLRDLSSYSPSISVDEGVRNFVKWYQNYYSKR